MTSQIIFIYCLCEELLKANQYRDDQQVRMSTAEVMTFAISSALFFGGNFSLTRRFFLSHRYFRDILSESRLNKRVHKIEPTLWQQVLLVAQHFTKSSQGSDFIIDSFPVSSCQTVRSWRCKLFPSKEHHGYCASKKMYYWGIKVHMLINSEGIPVEFSFTPASKADISALRDFDLNLPDRSFIYGDKAYTDYKFEDFLQSVGLFLTPQRKRNAKRQHNQTLVYVQKRFRKRIETVFSQITRLMPRTIHAVTAKGFILKISLFIVAFVSTRISP